MFKKRWGVVVYQNGELHDKFFFKRSANQVARHFNSMAFRTGYEVRFTIKDLKKGTTHGK